MYLTRTSKFPFNLLEHIVRDSLQHEIMFHKNVQPYRILLEWNVWKMVILFQRDTIIRK